MQIVLDQIRGQIGNANADQIRFLTAHEREAPDSPLAALIAIAPGRSMPVADDAPKALAANSAPLDSATILHAGPLGRELPCDENRLIAALASAIEDDLGQRGVNFVQWATDPVEDPGSHAIRRWCSGLGFEPLATLDYLEASTTEEPTLEPDKQRDSLRLESIPISRDGELDRFADLVEQTYVNTLDCPKLADHRSAAQTLNGYRKSNAYAPQHWYRALSETKSTVAGCMVLARHGNQPKDDAGSSAQHDPNVKNQPGGVLEIVYMGLLPSERGKGSGAEMVHLAKSIAHREGLDRVILAVDRENVHARSIYQKAGFRSLMAETVWGRSIG